MAGLAELASQSPTSVVVLSRVYHATPSAEPSSAKERGVFARSASGVSVYDCRKKGTGKDACSHSPANDVTPSASVVEVAPA